MEIRISKDISLLRSEMQDDLIIKILFDKVIATKPRRCKINKRNEILIKNYGISKKQNHWIKSYPIMTGINRWQLIAEARINIEKSKNRIIYRFNVLLIVIFNLFLSLCFALFVGIGLSIRFENIWYGIKIGLIVFVGSLSFFSLGLLFKYITHKIFLKDFLNHMMDKKIDDN